MKDARLNLRLMPSLVKEARALAKRKGFSLTRLVEDCLKREIEMERIRETAQKTLDAEQV